MVNRLASGVGTQSFCKFIYNDDNGADSQAIDGDEDGFFTQRNTILVDLTQALSEKLGRQLSQMSVYDVEYIRIALVNFDSVNDNEAGLSVSGDIEYWTPTAHRVNAMKLARQVESAKESTEIDDDSFLLSTQRDYKGMRFNWDADGQVKHATNESFTGLTGSEWDMKELFEVYGDMEARSFEYDNALWLTRTGLPSTQGWEASYTNYTRLTTANNFDPESREYTCESPISVLGGLLAINFTHSSVGTTLNTVDDDYLVQVTIGVKGWSDF